VKNFLTIILSILFTFAISSMPFATGEEKAVPATQPVPAKLPYASKVRQITGEVSAVNTNAMSIVVTKKCRDKVEETAVTIDDKTEIMKEKENKSFSDIKIGNKVVVKYIKVNGKNIAKNISIKTAKPESKEKEPEKQSKPAKRK
jgi:ribosomal protein S1